MKADVFKSFNLIKILIKMSIFQTYVNEQSKNKKANIFGPIKSNNTIV